MKRKHSVALGIGALVSLAYLVLIGVYLYGIVNENQIGMQSLVVQATLEELAPHLACALTGSILISIAFFSSNFTATLLSFLCFCAAVILALGDYYQYAMLCAPSILFSLIGCFFCHKRKRILHEEQEEREYREYHAKVKAASQQKSNYRHNVQQEPVVQSRQRRNNTPQNQGKRPQVNTQLQNQNYYRQPYPQTYVPPQNNYGALTANYQQPNYAYPYPMNGYGTDPLLQPTVPSPYDPLIFNQPPMNTNVQGGVPQNSIPNPENPMMPYPYMQPPMNQAAFNHADFQVNGRERTLADGYFDDYGNFHPGNTNNF